MINTDIAILILVGLLILALGGSVGLAFGRIGRAPKKPGKAAKSARSAAEEFEPDDPVPAKKPAHPSDYRKPLGQLKNFNARAAQVFGDFADERIPQVFDEVYDRINKLYESVEAKDDDWTRDEILAFYLRLLEAARFDGVQSAVKSAATEVANVILARYKEQLAEVSADPALSKAARKLASGAGLRTAQRKKITADILDHFSEVFEEIGAVEEGRGWLDANHRSFVDAVAAREDLGVLAQRFGSGYLAARRPLTASPAFIDPEDASDDARSETAVANAYVHRFSEFERRINALRESILEASEATKACVVEAATEVNGESIATLLNELALAGHSLDGYFKAVSARRVDDIRDSIPVYQG